MSRGLVNILISRLIFVLSGYVVHIFMARLLGPVSYGVFGICIAIITVCHVFLGSGVRQVVAKSAAKYNRSAKYFIKKGLVIQLAISLLLGFVLAILAKRISSLFHDTNLEKPLYLSSLIIVTQSMVYAYMGGLSGLKRFGSENALMSAYSIIKACGAVLFVYLGLSVIGCLLGYLLASAVALLLAVILTRNVSNEKSTDIRLSDMLKNSIPVIIVFSSISFIMNIDLLAVRYFIVNAKFTGYYTSAAAISRLAYFFLFAFGVVLLPFVSSSFHENDLVQTRKYVKNAIRYSMLLLLPIILLFFIYSKDVVLFIYGSHYYTGGAILRILIWGLLFLGLLSIFVHIMIGIEQEKVMVRYALIGVLLSIVANVVLVPMMGAVGGAVATMLSSGIVVFLSYCYIARNIQLTINLKGVYKIIISLAIVFFISYFLNKTNMRLVLKGITLCVAYFLVLLFLREIRGEDVTVVRRLVLGTTE